VIGPLASSSSVGMGSVDAAAAQLGVSRRQVYVLVRRWREGEGVVSDLIPGRSSGGRGRGQLPDDVEAVVREVVRTQYLSRPQDDHGGASGDRQCRTRGLPVPSRGTITRRIATVDPLTPILAQRSGGRRESHPPAPTEYVDSPNGNGHEDSWRQDGKSRVTGDCHAHHLASRRAPARLIPGLN
jgi:putative transposase